MTPSSQLSGTWSAIVALTVSLLLAPATAGAAPPIATQGIRSLFSITRDAGGVLSLPTDVAIGVDGNIYIVDGGNHRLLIFNRRGKPVRSIGQRGSKPAEFTDPVGLCTDTKGRVYVADKGNQRIQVFSADGDFELAFDVKDNGKPVDPVDVAASADGKRLYVTGNNNHKVLMYSAAGKPLGKWGGEGVNKGEFRYPATLTTTDDGRVYVVDVFNTRVQVFNAVGKYVLEFSGWGVLPGQSVRPKGIAMDRRGRIYVSDSYMDVVQVFNDAHQFVHVLGTGGKPHRFISAAGIAIDDTNRLYVAEVLKNRVSVYQLEP